MTERTITIKGFLGIDTVSPLSALPVEPKSRQVSLREAVNVDIHKTGVARRRLGRTAKHTGSNLRSLWSNERFNFFAEGAQLKRFEDNPAAAIVLGAVSPNAAIAYCDLGFDVAYSDGQALYRASSGGSFIAGVTLATRAASDVGSHLRDAFLQPMPGGHLLAYHKGRLFVARGNTVLFSEPQLYGYYHPGENVLLFPSKPTVLAATDNMLVVTTEAKSWPLLGDSPAKYELGSSLDYGAPAQAAVRVPATFINAELEGTALLWLGNTGVMAALDGVGIVNLTDKRVVLPLYDKAALMFRQQAGLRQLVAVAPSKDVGAGMAMTDEATIEVRRHGIVI